MAAANGELRSPPKKPTRALRAAGCPDAEKGHDRAEPPSSVMNSRRVTAQYLPVLPTKDSTALLRCGIFNPRLCRLGVKLRRTQYEHMFSDLLSNSDIPRCSRHFAFLPIRHQSA